MCLIGLAIDPPGPWRLVVAANRDEFHERRAAPASWWEAPEAADPLGPTCLLGGRDLQGGGTWLGLRRAAGGSLRVGALTNLRPGLLPAAASLPPGAAAVPPSRGKLVAGYLSSESDPSSFLHDLAPPPSSFAGFNLLAMEVAAGGGVQAWYLNNLPGSRVRRLARGIHLVSNATVDIPWPKTRLLESAMTAALGGATAKDLPARAQAGGDEWQLAAALLAALGDRTEAGVSQLPRTGLDSERERLLSAPFIVDEHYGTRCSTVLVVGRSGQVHYVERSFGPAGQPLGTVTERFVTAT